MFNIFRKRPPVGSTDWAAQQFLGMLDREEREKAERERLRQAGWRPAESPAPTATDESGFGDGRDAVANLMQRDIDYQRALQAEARRRAALGPTSASEQSSPIQVAQQGKEASPPAPAPTPTSAPTQGGTGTMPATPTSRQNYYQGGWSIDQIHRLSQEELLNRLRTLSQLPGPHPMLSAAGREANANLHLAPEMTRYEESLRQQFGNTVLNDPIVQSAERDWANLSRQQREDALRRIIELHAAVFAYDDPPSVTLKPMQGRITGSYDRDRNAITLNETPIGDSRQAVFNVAHEATHAYQRKLREDFRAGRIAPDDPRYPLAELLALTEHYYLPPSQDLKRYLSQAGEVHAEQVKNALYNAFIAEQRRRTGQ